MALELSYQFPGDSQQQFRLASARLGALSPDFAKRPFVGKETKRGIEEWFEVRVRRHWSSEGATSPGGRWPAWAPSTAARKGPGDRLMVETGRLRDALHGDGAGALRDLKDTRVELGVRLSAFPAPYPAYHQAGSPKTNLPIRRVVDMGPKDGLALLKVIQASLVRRAKAAGFISGRRDQGVSRAVR